MPTRQTNPEKRAKEQLAALSATTRKTVKALTKHPDDHRTWDILDRHEQEVKKIVSPKRKPRPLPPPSEFCWTCEKWHPRPMPQEWHLPVELQWPFAAGVTVVILLVFAFVEWWALWVFPVAWLASFSFFWGVIIPGALLMVVIVFLAATGIRF
jgi:hypothetical protein